MLSNRQHYDYGLYRWLFIALCTFISFWSHSIQSFILQICKTSWFNRHGHLSNRGSWCGSLKLEGPSPQTILDSVNSLQPSSLHVAKSHDDTTEGAVHYFQDEYGGFSNWISGDRTYWKCSFSFLIATIIHRSCWWTELSTQWISNHKCYRWVQLCAYRPILEAQPHPQMLHGKSIFAGGGAFFADLFPSQSCIRMVSNVATDSALLYSHFDLTKVMPTRSFGQMSHFFRLAFKTSLQHFSVC